MSRDAAVVLGLALLALLALGVAAATLSDPVVVDGEGFGFGGGDAGVTKSDDADPAGIVPIEFPTRPSGTFAGPCLTWLRTPWGVLAVSLLVLLPAAYVSYRTGAFLPGVAVAAAFGGPVYLVWLALGSCAAGTFAFGLPTLLGGAGAGGGGGGGVPEGVATVAASRPSLVVGLLLVLLVAATVLFFLSTGNVADRSLDPDPDPDPDETDPRPDVAAVGRAAGRAADRIAAADGDVGNEVYRAWAAMTDHLAVDRPASSTPAEFAAAAVAAGMRADDVDELTALFEEVRYGGRAATPDRESRAVAALRRIEAAYGPASESR